MTISGGGRETFLFRHQGMEETYKALEVSSHHKSQAVTNIYRIYKTSPYGYGSRSNCKGKDTQILSASNATGP